MVIVLCIFVFPVLLLANLNVVYISNSICHVSKCICFNMYTTSETEYTYCLSRMSYNNTHRLVQLFFHFFG
jgi:hypothetical protein